MIYTERTKLAMKIAYDAHHGQTDKSGVPYIFHPIHLAEQMEDENTTCVALLHDVVEDTNVTFKELEAQFPKEITEAIRLMTHEEGVDYFDYVRRLKSNPIARAVKLADLAHNSDQSRLEDVAVMISEEKRNAMKEKYRKAREILEKPERF